MEAREAGAPSSIDEATGAAAGESTVVTVSVVRSEGRALLDPITCCLTADRLAAEALAAILTSFLPMRMRAWFRRICWARFCSACSAKASSLARAAFAFKSRRGTMAWEQGKASVQSRDFGGAGAEGGGCAAAG